MTRAMAGGGEYDRHSDYQLRGALSHRERVLAAARRIPTTDRNAITLVDYGCAQGRVSEPLLREALAAVREAAPDVPCFVVHNDQPSNDWAGLLDRLSSDSESSDAEPGGPVTPMLSATSFYRPVTPPGQVDLGISFAAIQWLAEPGPSDGGTALYFDQLDEPACTRMTERAHRDWTRFLELRADELAPGGRLVLDME